MKIKNNGIIDSLNDKFFISDVSSNIQIKELSSQFNIDRYSEKHLWKITDLHDNVLFVFPCEIETWSNREIFNSPKFYFNDFNSEALRLFYFWLEKNFYSFNIESNFSSYIYFDNNSRLSLPLSLWKDNGIFNEDLGIDHNINSLPKNLTIKGNLNMENSSLYFLGNGLKVEGNIYASNSQLAVIDDSIEVEGKIFVEDSLLISYPTILSNKIVNPKRMKQVIRDF